MRKCLYFFAVWGLLAAFVPLSGAKAATLADAIADLKVCAGSPLSGTDFTGDGIVGLEDAIYALRAVAGLTAEELPSAFPTDLPGYTWAVGASYTKDQGNTIPLSYLFALRIEETEAFAETVAGFDPTKGILRQTVATAGQVPVKRSPYALSLVIPAGTRFGMSVSGDMVILTSATVTISASDAKNPTGSELKRYWVMTVNKANVLSAGMDHGTITENTTGFLPQVVSLEGRIYMTPLSPNTLEPLESF